MSKEGKFTEVILGWYKKNGRHALPWRKTSNPYRVLIAEFLLQKTTAEQVEEIYPNFTSKYSSPQALAQAKVGDLEKMIGKLGLRYRAQRLVRCAKMIQKKFGGHVPNSRDELLELPGVGDYISNSVLCFGFNKDVPVIDVNVERIFIRVFSFISSKARPRTDKKLWKFAKKVLPEGKAKEFNWGLLDLGKSICTANDPDCSSCPLKHLCVRGLSF